MFPAVIRESGEAFLAIVAICLAVLVLAKWSPRLAGRLSRWRILVPLTIVLVVLLAKVSEDVLARESGPVDEAVLSWIHGVVPAALIPAFTLITLSGSATVIFPLATIVTIALLRMRQRLHAVAVASTVLSAVMVVYVVKTLVGRDRPSLWETQLYWGSSFPSGHTLASAAFATAGFLCVLRLRPRWKWAAFTVAATWVALVGVSRLVLGVHWPTDVFAAACAGVLVALAVNAAVFAVGRARSEARSLEADGLR